MLKQTFPWLPSSSSTLFFPHHHHHHHHILLITNNKHRSSIFIHSFPIIITTAPSICLKQERESIVISSLRLSVAAGSRRRSSSAGYDDDCNNNNNGYSEELAMLEAYTQSSRNEVLLVTAMVDSDVVEILIFKGFSSCLSYGTSPDPSRSVLPARAVIKNIHRVKGPFNPSNIEYIEKDLTWETFKKSINPN